MNTDKKKSDKSKLKNVEHKEGKALRASPKGIQSSKKKKSTCVHGAKVRANSPAIHCQIHILGVFDPLPPSPGRGGGVDRLILLWEYRKLLIIVMYCDEYFIYKIITNGFLPEIMCTAIHIAENSEFQRL